MQLAPSMNIKLLITHCKSLDENLMYDMSQGKIIEYTHDLYHLYRTGTQLAIEEVGKHDTKPCVSCQLLVVSASFDCLYDMKAGK